MKRMTDKDLRKKDGPRRKRHRHFWVFILVGFLFFAGVAPAMVDVKAAEAAFTQDVPYQDAVPGFLEAISDAVRDVKDDGELEEIARWEEETRGRLPEFLGDLIDIAQQLEENSGEEFVVERYEAFAAKWQGIVDAYPGLSELEAVLSPLLEQLLAGLPALPPARGQNPVQNLLDVYRQMEQLNPWGTGLFWGILPLEHAVTETNISERVREEIARGYRTVTVIHRNVVVTLNGVVVFSELIQDGNSVNKTVVFRDLSVLHEVLGQMVQNGEDPAVIDIVEELVELADLNIESALDNGILDDCSYSFIHRKQLAGRKDTCIDADGNVLNFAQISKFDPFDHVNQVELSRIGPLTDPPASFMGGAGDPAFSSPSSLISDRPGALEKMFSVWFAGIMVPAYLWSIVSFARVF